MIAELTVLYRALEACDLNLLLHAAEKTYRNLTTDLKERSRYVAAIQDWYTLFIRDISPADRDNIALLHGLALERDKKIVAVISELRDKSKEEMLKGNQHAKGSPYLKRPASRGRISV